jgi:MYXO-CTERM domain-containing protein
MGVNLRAGAGNNCAVSAAPGSTGDTGAAVAALAFAIMLARRRARA